MRPVQSPKPSVNNNDDNVDGTVLEVERRQPGAFPISGPGGRATSSASVLDESTIESPVHLAPADSQSQPPVHPPTRRERRRGANPDDAVLVEADLVTPSDNGDVPVVEGKAVVEQSAADRKRKQRRRLIWILSGVLVVAAGIAVGVTLGINSNRPSPSPSPLPGTSIPSFRQLFDSLPNHTTILLQDPTSPQYKAWTWLATTEFNFDADVWQLRQRFALACFRFATTAFASYINSGPFSPLDVDECNWNGTLCNKNGNVTHLALPDSDLSGSVPRELYFLSELTALNLTNSGIEGSISSDIRFLSNLEVFVIAGTFLIGSIPTQLGRLSSLIRLDLSYTFINGVLPTYLGQLPNLRWLNLYGNLLSGPIPTHLGNLSGSLSWLDLSYNNFNGSLPSELGHLTQLEHLDLRSSFASIRHVRFPTELGRLSQLTYLNLNIPRSIAGSSPAIIPTEIGQLTRLEYLYLGGVKGTIPAEVGLMSRLTDLAIQGATGTIPTTFGQLTVLESLALTNQSLMGSIPTELGQLSALTELSLFFNDALTGTIPIDFLGLQSNLTVLSISNFNGTIPTELGLLSNNLQELWLRDSYVNGTIPTELGLLSELTYLDLSYKELTGTIPTELGRLSNLWTMYLVDASVTGNVPSEICQLGKISGGVLGTMHIDCDSVSCSCEVEICDCK